MYHTYILKSEKTKKYYIGYTSNLSQRIRNHNSSKNASTKPGIPWRMVYSESFQEKKLAWLREKQIKCYKGGEAFKKLISCF
jgi:putative endonuclease